MGSEGWPLLGGRDQEGAVVYVTRCASDFQHVGAWPLRKQSMGKL